ncbi:MAG: potassium efflux system protein [Phycisphaerales bacterium]|nr:MAG: potassium efflux system protein [Phycisphaerales bacterium]
MHLLADDFSRMAATLAIVAALGALALLLRQPLVVAFVLAGIASGPAGLGLVGPQLDLGLLAELGIAVLLFLVGLRLDVAAVRDMGWMSLLVGLVQVAACTLLGTLLARGLGWSWAAGATIGLALAFSSTIVVVKLLSDRRELDALHGRLVLGVLIVQDAVVILALILLPLMGAGPQQPQAMGPILSQVGWMLAKAALAGGVLALATRWVLPGLVRHVARSMELLLLASIAWAIALAAGAHALGLSKEVGAFVAGVSLASTPFRHAIGSRLIPLRDFLLVFFFIELGASLQLEQASGVLVPTLALAAFVLLGKPAIVLATLGALGYHRRTAFASAVSLGQISEFSLILAAMGVSLGVLDQRALAVLTIVAMATIACSTYAIVNLAWLYDRLEPLLRLAQRTRPTREHAQSTTPPPRVDVILVGLGRYGGRIGRQLLARGLSVYAVDFDPKALKAWIDEGRPGCYGDATDAQICETLPVHQASLVVCSAAEPGTNRALLEALRRAAYPGRFAGTAHTHKDARLLRRLGVDLVLEPFLDAADQAADRLEPLARRPGDQPPHQPPAHTIQDARRPTP